MTPYTLAKLLHEVYPEEFPRPDNNQPYDDEVCFSKKRKSGDVEITPIRRYWNPLTEPRDFVPLLVRFAGEMTDNMERNFIYKDNSVHPLKFWLAITPESFCTELEEYLKERVDGYEPA